MCVFSVFGKVGKNLNRGHIPVPANNVRYFQTENAMETVCIIEDPGGSISIGIARAGRHDIENRRITSEEGIQIARGRAEKARTLKTPLIEKNYLRGIHAMKVEV